MTGAAYFTTSVSFCAWDNLAMRTSKKGSLGLPGFSWQLETADLVRSEKLAKDILDISCIYHAYPKLHHPIHHAFGTLFFPGMKSKKIIDR